MAANCYVQYKGTVLIMSHLKWHGNGVFRKITRETPSIIHCIAKTIVRRAKRIVPVKTGKLRGSIEALDAGVVVTADYAAEVELGTATRAAQPYMRPAIVQFSKSDLEQCLRFKSKEG